MWFGNEDIQDEIRLNEIMTDHKVNYLVRHIASMVFRQGKEQMVKLLESAALEH